MCRRCSVAVSQAYEMYGFWDGIYLKFSDVEADRHGRIKDVVYLEL